MMYCTCQYLFTQSQVYLFTLICFFWAMTLEPEMLESQSRTQKTKDYSLISNKNLIQKLDLTPNDLCQKC